MVSNIPVLYDEFSNISIWLVKEWLTGTSNTVHSEPGTKKGALHSQELQNRDFTDGCILVL